MAEAKKKKGTPPSREKPREGAKEGFPIRQPRGGTHRLHDRLLTPAERDARQERRAAARKAKAEEQEKADGRKPKGWAGRRRER